MKEEAGIEIMGPVWWFLAMFARNGYEVDGLTLMF